MNRRREIFLEEMGLAPIWRLRRSAKMRSAPLESGAPNRQSAAVAAIHAPAGKAAPAPATRIAVAEGIEAAAAELGLDDRAERILKMNWSELKAAVAGCQACDLHKTRKQTVFGVGDERAAWLIVGEAPGAEEDAKGEPFVGQAGRLLDSMLAAIGMRRGQGVYIANVLKCRPPGNRNPDPFEVEQCGPHLLRQLELIQPKVVIAMGRFAVQRLLNTEATIGSLRGRVHRFRGVPLIVTYHPAYLLRNLADKSKAWEDLCLARRTVGALQ